MKTKVTASIRVIISAVLMFATIYCFFGLHDHLLTALGFFDLGVHSLITRTSFTPMFLVGLLFVSRLIQDRELRLGAHALVLVTFACQLPLMLKLKESLDRIKQNDGDFRSALWEHDLTVWVWRRMFKNSDAA